jgi:hypothetical protein
MVSNAAVLFDFSPVESVIIVWKWEMRSISCTTLWAGRTRVLRKHSTGKRILESMIMFFLKAELKVCVLGK